MAAQNYQWKKGDDRWEVARRLRADLGWPDVASFAKQMAADNSQITDWRRVPPGTIIALTQASTF